LSRLVSIWAVLFWLGGIQSVEGQSFGSGVPKGFPLPEVPEDNPLTEAKVELGRYLFFDTRLSADGTFACSTCHQPHHAFTDGRQRALGVTGQNHPRSTMALANVAYNASLNWADPGLRRLEEQMEIPMFSVDPVEMGISGHEQEVLARLLREPRYGVLFEAAFPDDSTPVGLENVILAIASFERTLLSGSSPYDRYVYWDDRESLSDGARRGMRLFFTDRLACSECHSGFNFSGPVARFDERPQPVFHNTALYSLDDEGSYPEDNQGVFEHTGATEDMGRFRAPTLRNIALTGPYMHDGTLPTLEAVIEHYAAGGGAASNPLKSSLVDGFEISEEEIRDLVSFLESLTDLAFLEDPRFVNPWSTP
jgi:cytochrome c peroxidase